MADTNPQPGRASNANANSTASTDQENANQQAAQDGNTQKANNPFDPFGIGNAFANYNMNLAQNPFDFFGQMNHMNPFAQVAKSIPQPAPTSAITDFYTQFFGNMTQLSQQIAQQSMRLNQQPQYTNTSIMMDLMEGWKKMAQTSTNHPGNFIEDQVQLLRDQVQLWQNTLQQMAGKTPEPVAKPEKGDKRFSDEEWEQNPLFN